MTYEEERLALKVETLLDEIDQLKHALREVEFKLEDRSTLPFNLLYKIYGIDCELVINYKDIHFPYKLYRWKNKTLSETLEFDNLNNFWIYWTSERNSSSIITEKEVFEIIEGWVE